jgi:hypothetical protein
MRYLGRVVSLIGLVFLLTGFSSSEVTFMSLTVSGRSDGADIPAALGRPGGMPVRGNPRVPWLVLNGGLERVEMKGPCGALKGRPNVTIELIEGAHHAWDVKRFSTPHNDPAGNVMLYSEEAPRKSHEIVRDFLAKNLNK